jgi:hypothetical protein
MAYIAENTFAAACYENSVNELEAALLAPADATDMAAWELTEEEYFAAIELALTAKRADDAE